MIIDAHTHGFHGKFLDPVESAGGNWTKERVARLRKRGKERPHYLDISARLQQLDRNHIDRQVVTPSWIMDSNLHPGDDSTRLATARALNDNMARLTDDSKGVLIAGGSVPLEGFEKGGKQEMERAVSLGIKAISIPSNIRGKPVDSPDFEPFWAYSAESGIPVYIHPADPAGKSDRGYESEYDLTHNFGWPFETVLMLSRLVFSGVMERYPKLKVVSHHLGGGMIPFFMGRINETYHPEEQEKHFGRVLPAPLLTYFSQFYYDTAVGGSASAIKCAYEVFGASQLVFATDAPNGPGTGEIRLATYPGVIRSLGLSGAENKQILSDNAIKILNLG